MGKRVLVTDDTAFMRMTLRNVLEKNGFEVVGELPMAKRPLPFMLSCGLMW